MNFITLGKQDIEDLLIDAITAEGYSVKQVRIKSEEPLYVNIWLNDDKESA